MPDGVAQRTELERYPADVRPYVTLAQSFLAARLSAVEFEAVYLELFKRDATKWERPVFAALNDLFLDIDRYNPDPELRPALRDCIDENELAKSAGRMIARIQALL